MNSATKYTNSFIMIIQAPTVKKTLGALGVRSFRYVPGPGYGSTCQRACPYNLKAQTLKHRSYGRDMEGLGFRVARQSFCNRVVFIRDLESVHRHFLCGRKVCTKPLLTMAPSGAGLFGYYRRLHSPQQYSLMILDKYDSAFFWLALRTLIFLVSRGTIIRTPKV